MSPAPRRRSRSPLPSCALLRPLLPRVRRHNLQLIKKEEQHEGLKEEEGDGLTGEERSMMRAREACGGGMLRPRTHRRLWLARSGARDPAARGRAACGSFWRQASRQATSRGLRALMRSW